MKFTKEQVLNFSTNWKKFHAEGKHKKRAIVIESGLPSTSMYYFEPQTHMISDLKFHHHILYNYLRNLPLERGMDLTKDDVAAKIRYIASAGLWAVFNYSYHSKNSEVYKEKLKDEMKKYTDIFGADLSLEILEDFKKQLSSFKYEKVVDKP